MIQLQDYIDSIQSPSIDKSIKYREHWDSLTHPRGSLGEIEEIGIKVCSILDEIPISPLKKVTIVMAGDNGIVEENICSSPVEMTEVLALEIARGGMGINALSKAAGSDVKVVDLGIKNFKGSDNILDYRINNGSKNFMTDNAMTYSEAEEAVKAGIEVTEKLINEGYQVIGTGEIGMGNTTTSAAIIKVLTNSKTEDVVGLGAGIDDQQLLNKLRVVEKGTTNRQIDDSDPIDILSKVGGFDIAALTGVFLAAAKNSVPVVIDGIISSAAALLAYRLNPMTKNYMIASHISKEKGSKIALDTIGLNAYLALNMRLGEGSGCPLIFQIIDSSIMCMLEMSQFEKAKIADVTYNIRDKNN